MMYMTAEPSFALSKPGKVKISSVKSKKVGQLVVKWKKKKSSGYQVQRALDKKFKKSSKKIKVKKSKKSLTIKKLKNGKKYYVRVRAFNKKGKKIKYGKWSKVKTCKVHKHKYVLVKKDAKYKHYKCKCGKKLKKKIKTKKAEPQNTNTQNNQNNNNTDTSKSTDTTKKEDTSTKEETTKNDTTKTDTTKTDTTKSDTTKKQDTSSNDDIIKTDDAGQQDADTDETPILKVAPTFSEPTNTKGKNLVTAVATNSRGQVYNYKLFMQSSSTYKTKENYVKKHTLTPEVEEFFGEKGTNHYLWKHGCSTCALTTVLRATVPELKDYDPLQVLTKVIRPVVGEETYKANFSKTMEKQMPISLKGIDKVLTEYGVKHKFVYTYTPASAEKEITEHLKEGDPIIFMLKEGLYAKYPHTMVMLGLDKDGKVIVGDSLVQKSLWGASAYGLIKYSKEDDPKSNTVANIVKYMDGSTTDISKKGLFYTKGAAGNRGYILINQID